MFTARYGLGLYMQSGLILVINCYSQCAVPRTAVVIIVYVFYEPKRPIVAQCAPHQHCTCGRNTSCLARPAIHCVCCNWLEQPEDSRGHSYTRELHYRSRCVIREISGLHLDPANNCPARFCVFFLTPDKYRVCSHSPPPLASLSFPVRHSHCCPCCHSTSRHIEIDYR